MTNIRTLGGLSQTQLNNAFVGHVDVANSSGDIATIQTALAALTTGGKVTGEVRTHAGKIARISTPTTISLGYSDTSDGNWSTDTTTEKVRLKLDILPDAGLGAALTIKGGYGLELDINVLGGGARGSVTDAAATNGSLTISSPAAIAAGLKAGAVVFLNGAGPAPEGIVQPLAASVRSVNSGAGTFTVSEAASATVSGATMTWFDVAVRVEDCVGLKLNIYGKGFQGYLLGADATDDSTKRIRSSEVPSVMSNGCAGALFWKSIEAFGSFGHIVSNTIYGDYIGQCADTHWDHWEGGVPQPSASLARAYLWFDRCGQMNNLSISAGDRATEAAILMTGDTAGSGASMGRFAQVRATMYQAVGTGATITSGSNSVTNVVSSSLTFKVGQTFVGPGVPDGTTITAVSGTGNGYTGGAPGTITLSANATATSTGNTVYGVTSDGLKLIGVGGVAITRLDTARCIAGLRVVGGGQIGIKVGLHTSLSSDISPMVVQAGTVGTTPRVDVKGDYRYHLGYTLDMGAGLLTGTDVRLDGYTENMHVGYGATGRYAARSASSVAVLDIRGLHQAARAGLSGFIDTTTVTLRGRPSARLDNEVPASGKFYTTDGSGGFNLASAPSAASPVLRVLNTAQVVVSNTTTETALVTYTIPANTVALGSAFRIKAGGSFDNDAAGGTLTFRVRIGGTGGTSLFPVAFTIPASAQTGKFWNVEAEVVFRAAASAATPTAAIINATAQVSSPTAGSFAAATNVNMTVNRDLVLDAIWSVASASDILRCEYAHIEQVA